MKYFTDQSLKNEISEDELDLGIVDVGETKKYSIWVLNDEGTLIKNLKWKLLKIKTVDGKKVATDEIHPEMKITKVPEIMPIDDRQEIVFTWLPTIDLKEKTLVNLSMTGKSQW